MATVKIKLGDMTITFADIIRLEPDQAKIIAAVSGTKTQKEWQEAPAEEAIRIPLTEGQKKAIVAAKKRITKGHTLDSFMGARLIRLSEHARKRVAKRLDGRDPDDAPSGASIRGIAAIAFDSEDLEDNARWKGHTTLSYSFQGEFKGKQCGVALAFQNGMLVVTITTDDDENTDTYYALESVINPEVLRKLKEML